MKCIPFSLEKYEDNQTISKEINQPQDKKQDAKNMADKWVL